MHSSFASGWNPPASCPFCRRHHQPFCVPPVNSPAHVPPHVREFRPAFSSHVAKGGGTNVNSLCPFCNRYHYPFCGTSSVALGSNSGSESNQPSYLHPKDLHYTTSNQFSAQFQGRQCEQAQTANHVPHGQALGQQPWHTTESWANSPLLPTPLPSFSSIPVCQQVPQTLPTASLANTGQYVPGGYVQNSTAFYLQNVANENNQDAFNSLYSQHVGPISSSAMASGSNHYPSQQQGSTTSLPWATKDEPTGQFVNRSHVEEGSGPSPVNFPSTNSFEGPESQSRTGTHAAQHLSCNRGYSQEKDDDFPDEEYMRRRQEEYERELEQEQVEHIQHGPMTPGPFYRDDATASLAFDNQTAQPSIYQQNNEQADLSTPFVHGPASNFASHSSSWAGPVTVDSRTSSVAGGHHLDKQSSVECTPNHSTSFGYQNRPGAEYSGTVPRSGQHSDRPAVLTSQYQPRGAPEPLRVVDASALFRKPGREARPSRLVVILRGLPGSGKSHLAKALRDVEVMNGGNAPRIFAMDDYFMTEEDEEEAKTAGIRKRKVGPAVLKYHYESEMEETYRASMFRAFRKTLEEKRFSFIIVDDRHVHVAQFAQFWASAKLAGYEVYIAETATSKDPEACTARNIHGFTREQVDAMAHQWEPIPSHYLALDVTSLFRQDALGKEDIVEVEMDADDMERDVEEQVRVEPSRTSEDAEGEDEEKDGPTQAPDKDSEVEEAGEPATSRHRGMSSWAPDVKATKSILKKCASSDDEEDDDEEEEDEENGDSNPLAGLLQAYSNKLPKETVSIQNKRVTWADAQDEKESEGSFSVGGPCCKRQRLIIGPGSGYVMKTNPQSDEVGGLSFGEGGRLGARNNEKRKAFTAQLRAEQEEFKSIGSRRREEKQFPDD